jgi:NH3-dependent NAD+ synthetase
VLDAILARYMEEDQGIEEIVAAGFARADVEKVTRLIKINEYKRRQAPVGIRITHRAFGRIGATRSPRSSVLKSAQHASAHPSHGEHP